MECGGREGAVCGGGEGVVCGGRRVGRVGAGVAKRGAAKTEMGDGRG